MITVHGGLEEISAGWDALAQECGAPPFERPGWFRRGRRRSGPGKPWVVVNRSNGETVAVLRSFAPAMGSARRRTSTHRASVCSPRTSAARELAAWVFERRPRSVTLEYVDPGHFGSRELEAAAASRGYRVLTTTYERSPFLVIDGTWEDYERGLSGRVRRDLDRRLRRLEEMGPVRLDVSDGTSGRAELLAEGFRLEPSGWKAARGTAVTSRENTRRFYEELAVWASENGWLRLSFLRVGEQAVAFQYGFEAGGTYYFLKGGYDPEYRRFAPGKLLLRALLERAFATGLRSFDFLGADDPFKLEWSETAYDLKLVQAFSRSPLGGGRMGCLCVRPSPGPAPPLPDRTAAFGLAAPGDEIRVDESCSLMCVGEDDGRTAAAWRADDDERAVVAAAEEQPGAPGVVVGGHDEELRPPARSGEPGDHPGLASGGEGVGSEADHLEVRRLARADGICCPALAAPAHRDDQRVGELLVEKGLCALEPLTVAAGPENDDCVCRLRRVSTRPQVDLEARDPDDRKCGQNDRHGRKQAA